MKHQQNINKAIKFFENHEYENSKKVALKIFKFEKNNIQLLSLLVLISGKLNDNNSKKYYLLKLIKLVEDPTVYQTLALLYHEENNYEDAKKYYEKALKIHPKYVKCYLYLSLIYMSEYNFVKAQELIFEAIQLTEGSQNIYESYHFLAFFYDKAEEYEKAFEIYAQLVKLNYQNSEMLLNFSFLCLKLNRYIDGFSFYRHRYNPNIRGSQKLVHGLNMLEKDIDIKGKNLLILGEQGIGDVIQFIRYLPCFLEKEANISVVVDALVLDLLKNSFPDIEFSNKIIHTNFDYSLLIGDAPYIFSSDYNNLPYSTKYLNVNKDDSLAVYEKYFKKEKKKKIGIVWRSNKSDSMNETLMLAKNRELHNMELNDFLHYFNQESVQLYSLQVKITEEERSILQSHNILSLGDNFITFYDNALIIDNLDALISINTTSAHISAALGKKTIMFLPDNSDWRWGIAGSTTNWYANMILLRQEKKEGWNNLIKRTSILNNLASL